MFLKLFKYDFKAIFFKFLPMLIVLAILSLLARVTVIFKTVELLSLTINSFFVIGCFVSYLYVVILCVMRYVQSLFKSQGYLMHTLPVSKHKLLLSQVLVDFLMALIATGLVCLCLMIAYLDHNLIEGIKRIVEEFFGQVAVEIGWSSIILMILSIIVSAVQWMFVIFLGIALGHMLPKNRTIFSILFCIALNYAIQFATSIGLQLVNTIYAHSNVISIQGSMNVIFGSYLLFGCVICVTCYILIIFVMKKHLNLE